MESQISQSAEPEFFTRGQCRLAEFKRAFQAGRLRKQSKACGQCAVRAECLNYAIENKVVCDALLFGGKDSTEIAALIENGASAEQLPDPATDTEQRQS